MRCPDCNKFVSFDTPEVEEDSVDIDFDAETHSGNVTGSVTINLNCADCGTNLKSASLEFDESFDHECDKDKVKADVEEDAEWEVGIDEMEGDSRTENKDRHGKLIKNPRYMKTFYGATVKISATCPRCGEVESIEAYVEEQASAFDENV